MLILTWPIPADHGYYRFASRRLGSQDFPYIQRTEYCSRLVGKESIEPWLERNRDTCNSSGMPQASGSWHGGSPSNFITLKSYALLVWKNKIKCFPKIQNNVSIISFCAFDWITFKTRTSWTPTKIL